MPIPSLAAPSPPASAPRTLLERSLASFRGSLKRLRVLNLKYRGLGIGKLRLQRLTWFGRLEAVLAFVTRRFERGFGYRLGLGLLPVSFRAIHSRHLRGSRHGRRGRT